MFSSHFSFSFLPLLYIQICTGVTGVLYLFLSFNRNRKKSVDSQSLNIRLGEVFVEFSQVEDGQHDTEQIDQDPDSIEDIMSVGPLTVTSLYPSILHREVTMKLPGLEDKMVHPSQLQRLPPEHH